MKQNIFYLVVGIILSSSYVMASNMTFSDQQSEDQMYCDMVNEGTWPNYKDIECGEE